MSEREQKKEGAQSGSEPLDSEKLGQAGKHADRTMKMSMDEGGSGLDMDEIPPEQRSGDDWELYGDDEETEIALSFDTRFRPKDGISGTLDGNPYPEKKSKKEKLAFAFLFFISMALLAGLAYVNYSKKARERSAEQMAESSTEPQDDPELINDNPEEEPVYVWSPPDLGTEESQENEEDLYVANTEAPDPEKEPHDSEKEPDNPLKPEDREPVLEKGPKITQEPINAGGIEFTELKGKGASAGVRAQPRASGSTTYEVVVRNPNGGFVAEEEVVFFYGSQKRAVLSNKMGVADLEIPETSAVFYSIRGNRSPFRSQTRINHILTEKTFPITFKVYIDGKKASDGAILITDESGSINKTVTPGTTESLPAGDYYFTFQNSKLSRSESYKVTRRNNFVFNLKSDFNSNYRDLYFKKNLNALKDTVSRETDPNEIGYFMSRYWLAQLYLSEHNDMAQAEPLLAELYQHQTLWEKKSVKPSYILDYLRCLMDREGGDNLEPVKICRDETVVNQFQKLQGGEKESYWKFQFYYYRIRALDNQVKGETGPFKSKTLRQLETTFAWLNELPVDTLNKNPMENGVLDRIYTRLKTGGEK